MDIHQKIIVSEMMKTNASRSPEEVIREIGQKALSLLERQGIAMDQCVGAGVGVPGTIDQKNGIVRYSNNIKWENVELAKKMEEFLPIPIRIANDADCAALGEVVADAGKECQEAYASVTALIRDAKRATGKELSPQEIFDGAENGDSVLKEVVDLYIRRLGIGIVNVINIFRPQLVLLGGRLSGQQV